MKIRGIMGMVHTATSTSGQCLESALARCNLGRTGDRTYVADRTLFVIGLCPIIATVETVFYGVAFIIFKTASPVLPTEKVANTSFEILRSSSFTIVWSVVSIWLVKQPQQNMELEALARLKFKEEHPILFGWCFNERDQATCVLIETGLQGGPGTDGPTEAPGAIDPGKVLEDAEDARWEAEVEKDAAALELARSREVQAKTFEAASRLAGYRDPEFPAYSV